MDGEPAPSGAASGTTGHVSTRAPACDSNNVWVGLDVCVCAGKNVCTHVSPSDLAPLAAFPTAHKTTTRYSHTCVMATWRHCLRVILHAAQHVVSTPEHDVVCCLLIFLHPVLSSNVATEHTSDTCVNRHVQCMFVTRRCLEQSDTHGCTRSPPAHTPTHRPLRRLDALGRRWIKLRSAMGRSRCCAHA